jgi:hypothetical protein
MRLPDAPPPAVRPADVLPPDGRPAGTSPGDARPAGAPPADSRPAGAPPGDDPPADPRSATAGGPGRPWSPWSSDPGGLSPPSEERGATPFHKGDRPPTAVPSISLAARTPVGHKRAGCSAPDDATPGAPRRETKLIWRSSDHAHRVHNSVDEGGSNGDNSRPVRSVPNAGGCPPWPCMCPSPPRHAVPPASIGLRPHHPQCLLLLLFFSSGEKHFKVECVHRPERPVGRNHPGVTRAPSWPYGCTPRSRTSHRYPKTSAASPTNVSTPPVRTPRTSPRPRIFVTTFEHLPPTVSLTCTDLLEDRRPRRPSPALRGLSAAFDQGPFRRIDEVPRRPRRSR